VKRLIIPIAVVLTVIILTGGFFLPTLVSQFKDRQTIGELTITDGSGVSYETKSELKIIDRLKMMTEARRVDLDNGKNMDADAAYQSALEELGKFEDRGIIALDLESCRLSELRVAFFIDSSDPSKSMIVWDLYIQNGTYNINVAVDDETGVLLAMLFDVDKSVYKKGEAAISLPFVIEFDAKSPIVAEDSAAAEDSAVAEPSAEDSTVAEQSYAEQIGKALAGYYGLTYVGSKPQKSDYYTRLTIELSDGQDSVMLPVNLNDAWFTINY
jgi:hypothetical protein